MARGGKRAGTPGTAYSNRTDMHQPIQAAPGGQYGSVKALEDAQRVVPLPNVNARTPVAGPQGQPQAPQMVPGDINFDGPTERPGEPVTAGLPVGPGPGPEALGLGPSSTDPAIILRSMYQNVPEAQNNDVLRLIEALDRQVQ